MAESPDTFVFTNEDLAKELEDLGKRLIEIGMSLRKGFEVTVEYGKKVTTIE